MENLTFSVCLPCLWQDNLHSDKTKQAFTKESDLDFLAGMPRYWGILLSIYQSYYNDHVVESISGGGQPCMRDSGS